jgi:hypothetical protein
VQECHKIPGSLLLESSGTYNQKHSYKPRRNVGCIYQTVIQLLHDEVSVYFNIFCHVMLNKIISNIDSKFIVTKQLHWASVLYFQVTQYSLHLNCEFLHVATFSNISKSVQGGDSYLKEVEASLLKLILMLTMQDQ